jgi:hypothetical protein
VSPRCKSPSYMKKMGTPQRITKATCNWITRFNDTQRPGREADHSPPSSVEVKNAWSYTSTTQYVFVAWFLVKHRDKFHLYFTYRQCNYFALFLPYPII